MPRLRVLIVDDEYTITLALSRSLPGTWSITTETSGQRALDLLLKEDWDIILLDLMIPHLTGMEIYKELQLKKPALCDGVIFITGGLYIPAVKAFLEDIANPIVLEKPFHAQEVVDAVLKLTTHTRRKSMNGTKPL